VGQISSLFAIWSVVAFLKKLPDVKEEDFKKWVQ